MNNWQYFLKKLFTSAADSSCLLCGSSTSFPSVSNGALCTTCIETILQEASVPCPQCQKLPALCDCPDVSLSPLPVFLQNRTSVFHTWYIGGTDHDRDSCAGRTAKMLLSCKKKYSKALFRFIAQTVAADLTPLIPPEKRRQWILTYVPRSRNGYLRYGFDQSEEIVAILGKELGIPVRKLLTRVGGQEQKTVSDSQSRRNNTENAFALHKTLLGSPNLTNRRILLFDDIITTGSSMRSASHILAEAGAKMIFPIAYAKTVPPQWRKNFPLSSDSDS